MKSNHIFTNLFWYLKAVIQRDKLVHTKIPWGQHFLFYFSHIFITIFDWKTKLTTSKFRVSLFSKSHPLGEPKTSIFQNQRGEWPTDMRWWLKDPRFWFAFFLPLVVALPCTSCIFGSVSAYLYKHYIISYNIQTVYALTAGAGLGCLLLCFFANLMFLRNLASTY